MVNRMRIAEKVGEIGFNLGGGAINWSPGRMAAATRATRYRFKVDDLVIEVRHAQIPLQSVNDDQQGVLSSKTCVVALNKKDLANPNIMHSAISCNPSHEEDEPE